MRPGLRTIAVRIPAAGGPRRYPVLIGDGALERLPGLLRGTRRPSRIHLIADERVWERWGKKLERALAGCGAPLGRSMVPPGERSKSAPVLVRLWRDLIRAGCDRRSCVVAFGGGVVGDLGGFAAASVLRGVDFIQAPTTLLAMVDASVGGKTGINLPEGKNLVGAFHQPRAVLMDLELLRTLPEREMRCGWAEVIKTAAIRDARLLRFLSERREDLQARHPRFLAQAVAACVRIKAEVVGRDEREGGLRMILNFGHTLAHAIEAERGYGKLLHGEAVAVGMVFAARLGVELGVTPGEDAARLEDLIRAYGLPTRLSGVRLPALLTAMDRDKKRGPRGLRWVLLERSGRARVHEDVRPSDARRALEKFLKN